MSLTEAERVFRPRPSQTEAKASKISNTVRAILDDEVEARERKTARLQIARLERELADVALLPAAPTVKPKRRAVTKRP
jgi:hypothetical protein